jgi:hypothetical protein
MAFIYEVNGQRIEFEKEPTDADIDEAARSMGTGPKEQSTTAGSGAAVAAAAPAVTAVGYGAPTGLGQLGSEIAQASQPLVQAGRTALQGYAGSPGKAIVDVGAAHLGLPPPYAAYEGFQGARNLVGGAKQTVGNLADMFSKLPPGTDRVAAPFVNALKPADQAKFISLANTEGLEKAFKTYQAPAYMAPEAVQSLNATRSAFPSTMQKVGQAVGGVAGPVLRGAARVAGPVGMGMSVYDAGQMARETGLGERLQQGQGSRAEQAFRAGPVQTYQGPRLDAQQAQNVLQSGSARDIQYFGGQDQLREQMRRKAAARVAGPIAPGPMQ